MQSILNGKYAPAGAKKHFGGESGNVPYLMQYWDGDWSYVALNAEDDASLRTINPATALSGSKLYIEAVQRGEWVLVEALPEEVKKVRADLLQFEQSDLVEILQELIDGGHIDPVWLATCASNWNS